MNTKNATRILPPVPQPDIPQRFSYAMSTMQTEEFVFLCAWEKGARNRERDEFTPALFCIEVPVLKEFIELHGSAEPLSAINAPRFASGRVVWDAEWGKLVFFTRYWSGSDRDFIGAGFFAADAEKVEDGQSGFRLVASTDGTPMTKVLWSITTSFQGLTRLLYTALEERKFVMQTERAIHTFSKFNEFEFLFRNGVEGTYMVSDVVTRPGENLL